MSVRLGAPYPTLETFTWLPNPELSDVNSPAQSVEFRRSMDNTVRTYVKTSPRETFTFTFVLTRQKFLELRAFILSYYRSLIHYIDHNGKPWKLYLTNNPFEGNAAGRAADFPGEEYATITLNLEGEEI